MSKNRVRFYLALAFVFAAFTVITFAVPFEKNATLWLSYAFALLALAVQIYAYPKAFGGKSAKSKFYGFPLARISTIYLLVQLALSLVFMLVGSFVPAWIPVILFSLLFAAAAVGLIAADAVKEEVERQDAALKANVETMRTLRSKAVSVADRCEDAETKKALNAFAEALRFSDPVSSAATADIEENLTGLLEELSNAVLEKDYPAAQTLCAKASALLADRNRICKLNK